MQIKKHPQSFIAGICQTLWVFYISIILFMSHFLII